MLSAQLGHVRGSQSISPMTAASRDVLARSSQVKSDATTAVSADEPKVTRFRPDADELPEA